MLLSSERNNLNLKTPDCKAPAQENAEQSQQKSLKGIFTTKKTVRTNLSPSISNRMLICPCLILMLFKIGKIK